VSCPRHHQEQQDSGAGRGHGQRGPTVSDFFIEILCED
jgi:hypothetical protein